MRRGIACFCLAVTAAAAADAQSITMTCVPEEQSEYWRVTAEIDPENATLTWNGESWEVTRFDERVVAARQLRDNQPSTLLINRETGKFWQTQIGRYCNGVDCSSTVLSSLVIQGQCTE